MSNQTASKECYTHCRIRKRILLVITVDACLKTRDVVDRLNVEQNSVTVHLLCTFLKGRDLEKAVKQYMRDNLIRLSLKDEVIYWEEIGKGGGAYDCKRSE